MTAPLLSIRQVAEMTGTSYSTIQRAAKQGRLASVRLAPGKTRVLFQPEDVEVWIQAHRQAPRTAELPTVNEPPAPHRRHPVAPTRDSLRLVPPHRRRHA